MTMRSKVNENDLMTMRMEVYTNADEKQGECVA